LVRVHSGVRKTSCPRRPFLVRGFHSADVWGVLRLQLAVG
jgi:hypothetical protein